MGNDWDEYVKDSRTACRYGTKCYQKNPEHRKTYKHPPLKRKHIETPNKKRFKPSPSPVKEINATTSSELSEKVVSEESDTKTTEKSAVDSPVKTDIIILPDTISYHDKTADPKKFKELFLVNMPLDFFKLFDCLSEEDRSVDKVLSSVNLELVGPYDLLQGKLPVLENKELYLIHWKFFYDPPEFQTVLKKKGQSQYHIGYFRDAPDEEPAFLGSNDSSKGCSITPMAKNIFGALYLYLQNEKKQSPFTSMACQKLSEKVKKWAEEHNFSLDEFNMKLRSTKTVAKSFHGAGIVVPYNKKTQLGYRPLVETNANIKKLFTKLGEAKIKPEKDKILSELQPVITFANIAVDECDFGTGLEAGIDLFCSGLRELEPDALNTLCAAYSLLNRDAYVQIIRAHLKHRRKGPNMSILHKVEQKQE